MRMRLEGKGRSTTDLIFQDSDFARKQEITEHLYSYSTQKLLQQMARYIFFVCHFHIKKGSLTLAMGKCLWFSVKIKVCQLSLSSP